MTISTPDAERAAGLADQLSRFSAETSNKGDWWCVTMVLEGQPETCVPDVLDTVRNWLAAEDIGPTSVYFDGHTHLVRPAVSR